MQFIVVTIDTWLAGLFIMMETEAVLYCGGYKWKNRKLLLFHLVVMYLAMYVFVKLMLERQSRDVNCRVQMGNFIRQCY